MFKRKSILVDGIPGQLITHIKSWDQYRDEFNSLIEDPLKNLTRLSELVILLEVSKKIKEIK